MIGKARDSDFSCEVRAVEAEQVDGSAFNRNTQPCHIVGCNILWSDKLWNVHVTIQEMIGEWCRLVFGSEEPNLHVSFSYLLEDLFDSLKICPFDLSLANGLVVDRS